MNDHTGNDSVLVNRTSVKCSESWPVRLSIERGGAQKRKEAPRKRVLNGLKHTRGNGRDSARSSPSNIVISGGNYTLEEIIAECKKPTIYLTSNWYTRFTNMMDGLFSTIPRDGMFLIENGEIKKPVRKLRLSDNLLRICSNISAIGKDVQQIYWWEVETPTFSPTIKVNNCTITAATQ